MSSGVAIADDCKNVFEDIKKNKRWVILKMHNTPKQFDQFSIFQPPLLCFLHQRWEVHHCRENGWSWCFLWWLLDWPSIWWWGRMSLWSLWLRVRTPVPGKYFVITGVSCCAGRNAFKVLSLTQIGFEPVSVSIQKQNLLLFKSIVHCIIIQFWIWYCSE